MKPRAVVLGLFLGVVVACGDDATGPGGDSGPPDGTVVDGGGGSDGTVAEGGAGDAGADAPLAHDATPGDGGPCNTAQAPVVPALRVAPVNTIAGGFATFAAQPPGSSDWYLVEQRGRIRIIRGGAFLPTPFLDINMGSGLDERGLLSIAFHPRYAENGRFFTMGTTSNDSDAGYAPPNRDAVVEWRRDPANPDVAVPTKVRDIIVLPTSDTNHNGGTIKFGPDNYLYVGTGDGGGGCEDNQPNAVQNTGTLFGKILRLDVDAPPPHFAPNSPFGDVAAYHYGLRNPYRFNFDPVTHDLFIGDVGEDTHEEVSVARANAPGKNFGWPAFEGNEANTCPSRALGGPSPHAPPIFTTNHGSGAFATWASVVGGAVYRGTAIPSLQGVYLFSDYYGRELVALRYCNGTASPITSIPYTSITATGLAPITSFAEGSDGELYVTYGGSTRIGRIVSP